MVITSGILTSLFIGFKISLLSFLFKFLFSFCLALFRDARLLDLIPISSSLRALEIVNFNSLLFPPSLFDLLSFGETSPFNLLVALCSANFLFSKSELVFIKGLEKLGFFDGKVDLFLNLSLTGPGLENLGFPENLDDFFSITTVFFD